MLSSVGPKSTLGNSKIRVLRYAVIVQWNSLPPPASYMRRAPASVMCAGAGTGSRDFCRSATGRCFGVIAHLLPWSASRRLVARRSRPLVPTRGHRDTLTWPHELGIPRLWRHPTSIGKRTRLCDRRCTPLHLGRVLLEGSQPTPADKHAKKDQLHGRPREATAVDAMASPVAPGLAFCADRHRLPLPFQRPLEEGDGCGLGPAATALRLGRLLRHELRPGEQRSLPLRGVVAPVVRVGPDRDAFRRHRLGRSPLQVDQQRLGLRRDLLRLGEDRLDRAAVLLPGDDLDAGVCRVQLQVEGCCLRGLLLVRRQLRQAVRERVRDPKFYLSVSGVNMVAVGSCVVSTVLRDFQCPQRVRHVILHGADYVRWMPAKRPRVAAPAN